MGRLIRKEWGRWEQNDGAMLHSRRGKSPGVGPWWKRKTVLPSDFVVLGVHILLSVLSGTLRDLLQWHAIVIAMAWNSYIPQTLLLFYCNLHHSSCARWLDFNCVFILFAIPPFYCSVWTLTFLPHLMFCQNTGVRYIFIVDSFVIKSRCLCSKRWSYCNTTWDIY